MKIIEALKRLGVIEKRIAHNNAEITKYASKLNTEMPVFESVAEQKKQVAQRVQANADLAEEYLRLKKAIDFTNLMTTVELNGKLYSIADLLFIKRKVASMHMDTYKALNDSAARLRERTVGSVDNKRPVVELMYSEEQKNTKLREWMDLYDIIDARLEVINATTELMEMKQ